MPSLVHVFQSTHYYSDPSVESVYRVVSVEEADLLSLLDAGALLTTNVFLQVSGIVSLADKTLDGLPSLSDGWWSGLVGECGIKSGSSDETAFWTKLLWAYLARKKAV